MHRSKLNRVFFQIFVFTITKMCVRHTIRSWCAPRTIIEYHDKPEFNIEKQKSLKSRRYNRVICLINVFCFFFFYSSWWKKQFVNLAKHNSRRCLCSAFDGRRFSAGGVIFINKLWTRLEWCAQRNRIMYGVPTAFAQDRTTTTKWKLGNARSRLVVIGQTSRADRWRGTNCTRGDVEIK